MPHQPTQPVAPSWFGRSTGPRSRPFWLNQGAGVRSGASPAKGGPMSSRYDRHDGGQLTLDLQWGARAGLDHRGGPRSQGRPATMAPPSCRALSEVPGPRRGSSAANEREVSRVVLTRAPRRRLRRKPVRTAAPALGVRLAIAGGPRPRVDGADRCLDSFVVAIVGTAPPLSRAQRSRLSMIFRP